MVLLNARPKVWDVKDVSPDLSDADLASDLAVYFNKISSEFSPLLPSEIPWTYDRQILVFFPYQVSSRIRSFKKPKSKIKGDIFPSLMTELVDINCCSPAN